MAKIESELRGDFDAILADIDGAVIKGSMSASYEDGTDIPLGDTRCAVRVYERYSAFGGNRVSMSVTLLEAAGRVFVTAITSGGSQAMFFKVNTIGEETFLDTVSAVIDKYSL